MRPKVGKQDLTFLPLSWFFWRQLTSPANKLMTNYVLFLLHPMKLINWQILHKQQVPPLFILPRGYIPVVVFLHWNWKTWRDREVQGVWVVAVLLYGLIFISLSFCLLQLHLDEKAKNICIPLEPLALPLCYLFFSFHFQKAGG